jgi:Ca2+-binding EF-hand superfamily protein
MRIDRNLDNKVSTYELKDFFLDNREYTITESDVLHLIKYYDLDKDYSLNSFEFQQILLPCEDNVLRQRALNRGSYRVGRFERLSFELEYKLNAVLSHEVTMMRKLSLVKNELLYAYDFTTYAAYRSLDRWNDGAISIENLKWFFRLNQKYLTDREALSIIRRIDTDGDAKISYNEFSDFLNN